MDKWGAKHKEGKKNCEGTRITLKYNKINT